MTSYHFIFIYITDFERELLKILGRNPCHVIKAKSGKFSIHLGRFHCLKKGGLVNDEVHICIYKFIMEHAHAYIAICTYNYMHGFIYML